jgi:hypothetical protein
MTLPSIRRFDLWLLVLLVALPVGVGAQTRSDTGRHQPEPPPEKKEDPTAEATVTSWDPERSRWYFGASGGIQGGGDLFRVATVDGTGVGWDPESGGGFNASRFTATFDRNFSLGFFVGRDLNRTWSVRADLGWSQMDVGAEALSGQNGAVYLFDRFDVLNLGLGLEARLTGRPSYPYANASLLLSMLAPAVVSELEQTNVGGRFGLGFLQEIDRLWSLRIEGRLIATGFSTGTYVPRTVLPDQPELIFEAKDGIFLYEFVLGVQGRL